MRVIPTMQSLRLAYIAVFLLSLMAVFTLWSQVGGQGHLDLVPWSLKLALGVGAAYAITRASVAAVKGEHGWNSQSVKWTGLALAALFLCGMASFYAHNNLEDTGDEQDQGDATVSSAYRDSAGIRKRLISPAATPKRPHSRVGPKSL